MQKFLVCEQSPVIQRVDLLLKFRNARRADRSIRQLPRTAHRRYHLDKSQIYEKAKKMPYRSRAMQPQFW